MWYLLFRAEAEVVERGHAVGLGPKPDRARSLDVLVLNVDVGLAVQRNADARRREFNPQRVPHVPRDRRVDVPDRDAAATLRVVQRDVVLERVGAGNVVVVAVLPAPHHAAGLVFLPGEGLEARFDEAVLDRCAAAHGPGKSAGAALPENVGRAGRGFVRYHRPSRSAAAGHALLPGHGQRAG